MKTVRNLEEILSDYPKEVILRDGTGVTLRPLQAGDAGLLHDMFMRLSEDDKWFLNHDVSDKRLIERWIADRDFNRLISIVALLEGEIIGNAAFMRKNYGAKSHIGKIRISVVPAYRKRRLGTWMLLDLHNLAMALGIQLLTMRLVQGRDASLIKSVKKLSFSEEALLKDYVLDRHGNSHNLFVMIKHLPGEWDYPPN